MNAVIGTLLFAVAVTLFVWSALQYRLPVPANWTRNTYAAMALALTSVVSVMFSGAFFSNAYIETTATDPLSLSVIATMVAIVVLAAIVLHPMIRQWRDLIRSQTGFAANFSAANDSTPGGRNPVSGSPNGSKPRRRKAA